MTDLRDLSFDTESQRLDALARLIQRGEPLRERALSLVAERAPRGLAAQLLAIARDADDSGWCRTLCLRALHRMGEEPAPRAFLALLGDAADALERALTPGAASCIDPIDVCLMARSPSLVEMTLAWIEGLDGALIPRLLEGIVRRGEDASPEVVHTLVARWVAEVPTELPATEVELATRLAATHTGALDLLERHWRPRVMKHDPLAADALDRVPALARRLADLPSLPTLLHTELVGTHGALVDALGPLPFARRLRNAVLRWSARELPPRDEHHPALYARYWRALRHLGRWEHGAIVVAHLLRGATLAPLVECELVGLWLRLDRPAARAWIETQVRASTCADRCVRIAQCLTGSVVHEDVATLHRLLDSADPRVRVAALRPLARRLEGGARWEATLRALATLEDEAGDVARAALREAPRERTMPALMREYFSTRDDLALDGLRGLVLLRWA